MAMALPATTSERKAIVSRTQVSPSTNASTIGSQRFIVSDSSMDSAVSPVTLGVRESGWQLLAVQLANQRRPPARRAGRPERERSARSGPRSGSSLSRGRTADRAARRGPTDRTRKRSGAGKGDTSVLSHFGVPENAAGVGGHGIPLASEVRLTAPAERCLPYGRR